MVPGIPVLYLFHKKERKISAHQILIMQFLGLWLHAKYLLPIPDEVAVTEKEECSVQIY